MATRAGDAAIVKAIVSLGLGFGLKLVAEGIESGEQAATLRRLGCPEGQGYLFGRAMPFNELLQAVEQDVLRGAKLPQKAGGSASRSKTFNGLPLHPDS
ncbi:EAL domain-containing protein (plasmid) [Mesorhizobium loti]|nr:EAL domain-containing protein [Mesorhizobium loti]